MLVRFVTLKLCTDGTGQTREAASGWVNDCQFFDEIKNALQLQLCTDNARQTREACLVLYTAWKVKYDRSIAQCLVLTDAVKLVGLLVAIQGQGANFEVRSNYPSRVSTCRIVWTLLYDIQVIFDNQIFPRNSYALYMCALPSTLKRE